MFHSDSIRNNVQRTAAGTSPSDSGYRAVVIVVLLVGWRIQFPDQVIVRRREIGAQLDEGNVEVVVGLKYQSIEISSPSNISRLFYYSIFCSKLRVRFDAWSGHGDKFCTRVHRSDGVDFQTDFHFVGYFTVSNIRTRRSKAFPFFLNGNQQNLYPVFWRWTQWAAVRMYRLLITVPPHPEKTPGKES